MGVTKYRFPEVLTTGDLGEDKTNLGVYDLDLQNTHGVHGSVSVKTLPYDSRRERREMWGTDLSKKPVVGKNVGVSGSLRFPGHLGLALDFGILTYATINTKDGMLHTESVETKPSSLSTLYRKLKGFVSREDRADLHYLLQNVQDVLLSSDGLAVKHVGKGS